MLLLRVAQEMYPDGSEEVLFTLDLLSRLVSFNKVVCTVVFFNYYIYADAYFRYLSSILSTYVLIH